MKLLLIAFGLAFLAIGTHSVNGDEEYGPGDTFYVESRMATAVMLPTLTISVEPMYGDLLLSDGTLVYEATSSLSISDDYFEAEVEASDGSVLNLSGLVVGGEVEVEISQTVTTGNVSFEYSIVNSGNEVVSEHYVYAYGANVNVISGNMAAYMFLDIIKDIKSWLFPGVVINQTDTTILVWNNDGFFWLPPGTSTSPTGDYADFVLVNGTWYKVGPTKIKIMEIFPGHITPVIGGTGNGLPAASPSHPLTPPSTDLGDWNPPVGTPTGIPTWGVDYDEDTPYPQPPVGGTGGGNPGNIETPDRINHNPTTPFRGPKW